MSAFTIVWVPISYIRSFFVLFLSLLRLNNYVVVMLCLYWCCIMYCIEQQSFFFCHIWPLTVFYREQIFVVTSDIFDTVQLLGCKNKVIIYWKGCYLDLVNQYLNMSWHIIKQFKRRFGRKVQSYPITACSIN